MCLTGVGECGESEPESVERALELGVLDLPVSTVTPVPLPQARALLFCSWNKNDVLAGYREWERVVIEVKKKTAQGDLEAGRSCVRVWA